jgi:TfoX/Sxy family transcriptional regulator of competence genes
VSTESGTVAFIEDQLGGLPVRTAKMFGEYGIYCDEKIVGLICNDTLFIKPSEVDAALLVGTELAPPYTGAKDYHSVPGDRLEDREWLQALVRGTADALPAPKPKSAKKTKQPTQPTQPTQRPSSGGGGF